MNNILKSSLLISNSVRSIQASGLKSWTGGVQYDGFKYFPRYPDEKDPPYEPTKLFMVQRIKPFKGNEHYYKKILVHFDLHGKKGEVAIIKNTPDNVKLLYLIKHLVRIQPIRTPNGLPSEDDLGAGFLKENGEFVVSKRFIPDEKRLHLAAQFQTDPARLDVVTLKKFLRDKWENPW